MKRGIQRATAATFVFTLLVFGWYSKPIAAQDQANALGYAVTEVMIPVRDGAHLNTKIFAPKDRDEPLPEPPRLFRRLVCVSQAAMARLSSCS
jgi:hypothetical protein